jgi:hypothetical protein
VAVSMPVATLTLTGDAGAVVPFAGTVVALAVDGPATLTLNSAVTDLSVGHTGRYVRGTVAFSAGDEIGVSVESAHAGPATVWAVIDGPEGL